MSAIPDHCTDEPVALDAAEIRAMAAEIDPGWDVLGAERLERRLTVRDFQAGLDLVVAIGAVAEEENHHPDLTLADYRKVVVSMSTHDVDGLSGNDFALARRIDALIDAAPKSG
ncbi:MAG: 4a-hydroxytetrahydrobiopterin dehydratase [Planctomycetota bacterium]